MTVDLGELARLLEQDPEQRAAVRRALFGDQPDLGSALATLTERVDALAQAQGRTEQRLEALTAAQERTEQRLDALAAAQERTEQRLDALAKDVSALAAAQRATADNLNSLVDTVRGMQDRLAKLDGDALERRYRERGHAYLMRIARRLRLLDANTLSPLVDDAERTGWLTAREANSVSLADAVFSGRRRDGDDSIHLVIEASVTIDRHDVRRARERADLLARVVDTPVLGVVAGDYAPEPVIIAAQDAELWCVTNGRTVAPTDDLGT